MDNRLNKPLRIIEAASGPDNRALAGYLARVAAGDRAGFGMLYHLTSARMWSVIRRMVVYRQPAEDVLQETYLTIWRKAHLFDPAVGEAMGWMTTIARHRAIEWLRQPVNAAQRSSSTTDAAEEATAQDQAEQTVLFGELLGRLPREQRESLFLVYFYGMTQEEVSSALDVPLGTIKSRVRRGLIALKDLLEL